jgi:polyhydroxyalkanoate synthesis regulator phasin
MPSNERIRKYLDAGSVLGQVSRGRAEEIVRELVNAGDIQRSQAQEWVDTLVERSRKSSEQVLDLVRHEVSAQLGKVDGKALESLANQVADVLRKSAEAGRKTTRDVTAQASKVTKQATAQASKTASRARDAATRATPGSTEAEKPKKAS